MLLSFLLILCAMENQMTNVVPRAIEAMGVVFFFFYFC
jgi:hypothetical protein